MKLAGKNGEEYTLYEPIGEGAFGRVYSSPPNTKQPYAVKQIQLNKNKNLAHHKNRIKQQVAIIKRLNHPNIVKLYDSFESRGYQYIIMELCETNLKEVMKDRTINQRNAISIIRQISEAIHYLHSNNIAHRDLKPENILINSNNQVKIADFGLSKQLTQQNILESNVGTPIYMAPEVFLGREYTMKCDIWSAGIIFYELLTHSRPPWVEAAFNTQQLLTKIIQHNTLVLPRGLLNWSKTLLQKMIVIDQERRIGSKELLQFVKSFSKPKTNTNSREKLRSPNNQKSINYSPAKSQKQGNLYSKQQLQLLLLFDLQFVLQERNANLLVYDKTHLPTQQQMKTIREILSHYNEQFGEWFKRQYPQIKKRL